MSIQLNEEVDRLARIKRDAGDERVEQETVGIGLDERSNIKTDTTTRMSSVPGVFAAGDARRGQSLIVWAIAEGREVARCVDEYLTKQDSLLPKVRIEAFAY